MFRFANIEMLWCLIAIPVFVIIYIVYSYIKKRQIKKFGDPELINQLMPDASRSRSIWKFSLILLALALLIIAAARPQYGQGEITIERSGIEVMIAMDISNSMLAEDVSPNRLERSKRLVDKLVDEMENDKVGLVVFAGEAFTQLPITSDYTSAKMFLNSIFPDLIRVQGTALGAAIDKTMQSLSDSASLTGKAIILITDGEDHEEGAIAAAKKAQEQGVKVFVVGVGKPEGALIPIPGKNDHMRDKNGQVVVSGLNENMCEQIAQAGGGVYVHCDNTNGALEVLREQLDEIKATELDPITYTDYNEQYQSFVLLALLLLIVEFFIMSRKNHRIVRMNLFREKAK
jgi:Ca-activated chloride channel family protein